MCVSLSENEILSSLNSASNQISNRQTSVNTSNVKSKFICKQWFVLLSLIIIVPVKVWWNAKFIRNRWDDWTNVSHLLCTMLRVKFNIHAVPRYLQYCWDFVRADVATGERTNTTAQAESSWIIFCLEQFTCSSEKMMNSPMACVQRVSANWWSSIYSVGKSLKRTNDWCLR